MKPKTRAIDPAFERIARAFAKDARVTRKKMFSSESVLAVDGKIFAMVNDGKLVVKLPKDRVDEMVESKDGVRFDPRKNGKVMKEWAVVPAGKQPWIALAREAYRFVKGRAGKPIEEAE
ncbi:MAG: TfoX/Sxy family protein [Polyangiaceae bacterium]